MINAIIKYMLSLFILTAFFNGVTTEDVFFHLGWFASMIFGFMLRIAHMRKKYTLTKNLVIWHGIVTICICWAAFICQKAYFPGIKDFFFMLYLFCAAFFAVVLSHTLDVVGTISIKEYFQILARKYLFDKDKEEKE